MALIVCAECSKPANSKARACPNCGAKTPQSHALLITIICLPVLFVAWDLVRTPSAVDNEKSNARYVIERCWADQRMKSNSPGQPQGIASMCERFEGDFKGKYGHNP